MILDRPLESDLWPAIERGIVKSMSVETCNCDLDDVVSGIGDGRYGVVIVQDEGEIVMGVAVLSEEDGWVDVPFLWSAGIKSLNSLFEEIEEVARLTGSKGVKWCSANEQGHSYAARRGYRQRLVEYVKEV